MADSIADIDSVFGHPRWPDWSPEEPLIKSSPRRAPGSSSLIFLALSALFAQHAVADAYDTFSLVPTVTRIHDDNLFRLSSSADPQTVLGESSKADDLTVTSLTFRINKPYALQRFEFEISQNNYRYQTFSYLNYSAQPYKAAWRWSLTPYLHGNLTTNRTQVLQNFADYTGYNTRNSHTEKYSRFDGVLDVNASWHVLAAAAQSTSSNSQLTLGQGNSRVDTAEAGIRYVAPSGSSLSYLAKNGRGEYINRPDPILAGIIDNRFDDRENEFRMLWRLTGKTSIDGRLARFDRTHAHFSQRDYGGTVGDLNFNWNISGKSVLTASLARELASYQTNSSSYTTTDRLTLMPYWQVSSQTAVRLRYDHAQRDYLGAIAATPANNRSDTLRTTMIALEWQPYRTLAITTSLQNEKRTSNQPGLDYLSKSFTVTAQMTF